MIPRVFLVEDNAAISETLLGAVEEVAGVEVVGMADCEADATLWLTEHSDDWDVALVDLFLRDGSGLGVVRDCQGRRTDQKIVVLTNYAEQIRQQCALLGADRVFEKSDIDLVIEYLQGIAQDMAKKPEPPRKEKVLRPWLGEPVRA